MTIRAAFLRMENAPFSPALSSFPARKPSFFYKSHFVMHSTVNFCTFFRNGDRFQGKRAKLCAFHVDAVRENMRYLD